MAENGAKYVREGFESYFEEGRRDGEGVTTPPLRTNDRAVPAPGISPDLDDEVAEPEIME